jgi:hypothetical protein
MGAYKRFYMEVQELVWNALEDPNILRDPVVITAYVNRRLVGSRVTEETVAGIIEEYNRGRQDYDEYSVLDDPDFS